MEGLFRENRILCLTVRLTRVTKEISKAEIRYFLSATSKYQKYQPKYAQSHVNTCISGGQGGIRSPYAPSGKSAENRGSFCCPSTKSTRKVPGTAFVMFRKPVSSCPSSYLMILGRTPSAARRLAKLSGQLLKMDHCPDLNIFRLDKTQNC